MEEKLESGCAVSVICDKTNYIKLDSMENSRVENKGEGEILQNIDSIRCHSCKHLYSQSGEVVLTPVSLCHPHDSKEYKPSLPLNQSKSWKARRYEGLCRCNGAGQECQCYETDRNLYLQYIKIACWGPKIKKTLLVIAASIPFIFLIVYLVFTYK
ncbi:hypothetical protein SK128_016073 [Halocaridina rubra]|uniref:Uncharacterized protein n=1 Tax=Halocaridina rubra TaxID=373956 RepID=A0AAN8WKC8_HALRR